MKKIFPKRFELLKIFIIIFLIFSTLARLVFFSWSFNQLDFSIVNTLKSFAIGLFYDLGTVSFFTVPYVLYLLLYPKKLYGNKLDKYLTYFAYTVGVLIFIFSFIGEITFWEEFKRRYNFIAVDYLVYTNEVLANIYESYPISIIIIALLLVVLVILYFTKKKTIFDKTFNNETTFKQKIVPSFLLLFISLFFTFFIENKTAEQFLNRYQNEISKNGIYSIFAAFRNNELSYTEFYKTIDENEAFKIVKNNLQAPNVNFNKGEKTIRRIIKNTDSLAIKPNVIFICIESMSSKYMDTYGANLQITPTLDSLTQNSIFFHKLYATGTRTVRGMEAITLSIPPTPGRSIVKRENNTHLFTIGEVFKQKGYDRTFFYGGDGYFDNMNNYFGGNGFDIVDRGRGYLLDKNITTNRININDNEVRFENAWGVCDQDLFDKVLKEADKKYKKKKPFFNFIMTTSNHRPYSFPEGLVKNLRHDGRWDAVKYTDLSIGEFLKKAKQKPWYKNTVFVIMADHCAASSGKDALDIKNYLIPGFIVNLPNVKNKIIEKTCSQIDIFPTLFSALNWTYESNLYGKNVFKMKPQSERAFIGNHRKLGYFKNNEILILDEQNQAILYNWNSSNNKLTQIKNKPNFEKTATSFYETADFLFKHEGLKIK